MEIFFAEPDQITADKIILDESETKHIIHTLRKQKGDVIWITDGQGKLYRAVIKELSKRLKIEYTETKRFERLTPELTLAVGFIRPNRLDTLIEKCTEIGISKFIIFRSEYANYISLNTSRMNKILKQAIKQSLQYFLPTITLFEKFTEFIDNMSGYDLKVAAIGPDSEDLISSVSTIEAVNLRNLILTIGPEGGFSENEIHDLIQNNFKTISLGKTRLRTETAAIAGASVLQSYIQHKKETNIGIR